MSRILVIEDNADLAFGLSNNLEIEGHEVEVVGDGEEGLARARDGWADLVVLDLMLPGMDGFRVLRELRASAVPSVAAVPVLLLTARGEESDKVRGLKLGADDYVTKPFGLLELLARVEALLRRAGGDGTRRSQWSFGSGDGRVEVDAAARRVTKGGEEVELAPKELDLLLALLRADGAAVSRLDLLRDVWDYSGAVVTRTVDTHVAELRKKIETDPSDPQHVLTVRKVGYRLER